VRHRAWGAIGLMLIVAWQSAAACHGARPALREGAALDALIAASLCSTSALSSTAVPGDAASALGGSSPTGSSSGTTAGAGCLHCAQGGCAAGSLTGGWLVASRVAASSADRMTARRGDSGAPDWHHGHPVRGPPAGV
jgi:hypothetical protein